jgi:hypothetical protein
MMNINFKGIFRKYEADISVLRAYEGLNRMKGGL